MGTGLGLAICKRLVNLMHGEIDYQSAQGQGTTFWVHLPLQISSLGTGSFGRASYSEDTLGLGASKNILVVEHNEVDRDLFCLQLKQLQCQCFSASTGIQALQLLQNSQNQFAMILVDVDLFDTGGAGLVHAIRKRMQSTLQKTKLILVHNINNPDAHKLALEAGADDHLTKPVSTTALRELLTKWVD